MAKTPEDLELNTEQLSGMLESIAAQLSQSYLERKSKEHKEDPLQELQDAIQEITDREKELNAAVGIAKLLLENNQSLKNQQQNYTHRLESAQNENHRLQKQIQDLKSNWELSEQKCEDINSALVTAEEQVLVLDSENRKLKKEISTLRELPETQASQIKEYELHVESLKEEFHAQFREVKKTNYELERERKNLLESKNSLQDQLDQVKNQVASLENEKQRSSQKIKELETQVSQSKENLETQTQKFQELLKESNKYKKHCEKLEEEIKVLEHARQNSPSKQETYSVSLMAEFSNLEDIAEEDIFKTKKESQVEESGVWQVISIPCSKVKRKDPTEEYFTLTTQAIKLNSPFMDTICTIPTQNLYQKALQERVPFHKWHLWIESQLNSYYIQQIYSSEKSNPQTKSKKKRILPF